ncbi:unnamed protein product, partial [Effrenium voratum]
LGQLAHGFTAFQEILPRPPTKVRVISPELRAEIDEKLLAAERARKSGNPEEAEIEEARKIESHPRGQRGYPGRGPGPFGPPGAAGPVGGYHGNSEDYDTYHGASPGRPRRQSPFPRGRSYQGFGKGKGKGYKGYGDEYYRGRQGRAGSGQNGSKGQSTSSATSGKSKEVWKQAPPDVVPWKGKHTEGPCDPEAVFDVRLQVQKIAPLLLGSGCEKYVMDADKLLNDLPTDRASDMRPACRNNYLVKSTAKTVNKIERCAAAAVARAEHVNVEQKEDIQQIAKQMKDERLRVLVPINSYSAPATFPGHVHMGPKDWENFNKSNAVDQLANQRPGTSGLEGSQAPGSAGHGPGHGRGHDGQNWRGDNGSSYGDTYGKPDESDADAGQGGGKSASKGMTPKQQYVHDYVENARRLAEDRLRGVKALIVLVGVV